MGSTEDSMAMLEAAGNVHHNKQAASIIGYNTYYSLAEAVQPRPADWADDYEQSVLEAEEIHEIEDAISSGCPWDQFPEIRKCAEKSVPHPDGAHTEDGELIPSDGSELAEPPAAEAIQAVTAEFARIVTDPTSHNDDVDAEDERPPIQMEMLLNHPSYRSSANHAENEVWNGRYTDLYKERLNKHGPVEYARYIADKDNGKTWEEAAASPDAYPWSAKDREAFVTFLQAHPKTGHSILVRVANKIHPRPKRPSAKKDAKGKGANISPPHPPVSGR